MTNQQAIESTKMIKEVFPNCKITIITTDPDPAKNLEVAKAFGKAGVRGKWRRLKEE